VADESRRIDRAFAEAFGRPPTPTERAASVAFVTKPNDAERTQAWIDFCHGLTNAKEFLYVR
jgi:hypothetical protein